MFSTVKTYFDEIVENEGKVTSRQPQAGELRAAGELLYVLWAAQDGQRSDLQGRFDVEGWSLLAIRS